MQKFFDSVIQAIIRHINFDVVKCVLLASPGFVKDQLFDYMIQWATKTDEKKILDNKSKFVLAHSSSGFKHSVRGKNGIKPKHTRSLSSSSLMDLVIAELLSDPNLTTRLSETKAAGEVKALETFYQMMHTEPTRAYYGQVTFRSTICRFSKHVMFFLQGRSCRKSQWKSSDRAPVGVRRIIQVCCHTVIFPHAQFSLKHQTSFYPEKNDSQWISGQRNDS